MAAGLAEGPSLPRRRDFTSQVLRLGTLKSQPPSISAGGLQTWPVSPVPLPGAGG